MQSRCRIGRFVVDAKPAQLADGSGWLAEFSLEEHLADYVDDTMFFGRQVLQTREDAIQASFMLGRREVAKRLVWG